jgi:multidrug resistance protein
LQQVTVDLDTTATITNLSIALYMLSLSIFPLWWSSFSEVYGRRTIYLISFTLYMVFNVLAAVSPSIAMLTVFRLLSGGASASVQAVGAGTIADIWETRERGRAMGIFYLGPLCGPLFAPIIGGALANKWGWRSTLWFMVVYGGLTFIFIFFALPETLAAPKLPIPDVAEEPPLERQASRVSSRQVVRHTTRTIKILKSVLVDPLHILFYLRFPAVLLTVYYSSISFGSLYMLNISIQESFSKAPYEFSTLYVGLLYIPSALGYFLGSIFGGRWMDNIMQREAKKANRYDEKGRLVYHPEDRMRENAWLGALLYPLALIWYGWTVEKGVYWLVPVSQVYYSL